ncbi:sn-glycerol-3-phosphate ABC transporter ATP-binding protein UgpC [Sansalvadorimonas sp. 2012CJ34-2]|uniref:Sn-glycerol-3-phosphate ABC transporter ATP-binding protein UgpC n=1 Tax=Parendozoicomonas callyspongiae TaxID=2942213 RepID=A0ABT0PBQ6_9GAMM|nr:sn-glycerol-3-phosphate ABC transporter ATP-binding protein UgpC [Sansalvadorimonas sp. 2012CJ34-2]MCL6268812.1 sn-glycerol-3-phosphate ABC transporter ATP-binding protein UgpC [Sansalvadorimonas sp. 2012CJ34-2]
MAKVELKSVVKRFGDVRVVHGIDLEIADNEFIVLVGPSGCGKSTILRMVAGLESISDGEIYIGDRCVNEVDPKSRNVAMVFQNYALYPHMTVHDNMGFSLDMAKRPQKEINEKVRKAASMLELEPYLDRKPEALSGGQRQRVAMGRAIVRQPDVFLFDEPLSNLDAQLRTQMRMELKKLHMKFSTTTIYVTHDQIEAMTLADRIVILKDGLIQQVGTPVEVYEKPANVFVAQFIGNPPMNILEGTVARDQGRLGVRTKRSFFPLQEDRKNLWEGQKVLFGLRPDAIKIGDSLNRIPPEWRCTAQVELTEILGGQSLLDLVVDDEISLIAEVEGRVQMQAGSSVEVGFCFDRVVLFDPETEEALSSVAQLEGTAEGTTPERDIAHKKEIEVHTN